MTDTAIAAVTAREILDSRGRPTVEADVRLAGGAWARASVPSGASTGAAEAFELRDGDPARFDGRGVTRAVAHVRGEIAEAIAGRDALDQAGLDEALTRLDGTPNLARLGANAILAVSIATARAGAAARGIPLHLRLAEILGVDAPTLPMPMVNILSGGLHARRGMDVQDFLVIPVGAGSWAEALEWACRVRDAAARVLERADMSILLADEGGLAPGFSQSVDALDLMVRAFNEAGLRPGEDVAIALDVAASTLACAEGRYDLRRAEQVLDAEAMVEMLADWTARYPIVSIEDGLGEDDWAHWPALTRRLGALQLVGDDLFATQPARIARGVAEGCANAALIKINQNGTLTGACAALTAARRAGWATVVSARSGETDDAFIADFAVGAAAGQIKIGSTRNAERLAKYNQLTRLEEAGLPFAGWRR